MLRGSCQSGHVSRLSGTLVVLSSLCMRHLCRQRRIPISCQDTYSLGSGVVRATKSRRTAPINATTDGRARPPAAEASALSSPNIPAVVPSSPSGVARRLMCSVTHSLGEIAFGRPQNQAILKYSYMCRWAQPTLRTMSCQLWRV